MVLYIDSINKLERDKTPMGKPCFSFGRYKSFLLGVRADYKDDFHHTDLYKILIWLGYDERKVEKEYIDVIISNNNENSDISLYYFIVDAHGIKGVTTHLDSYHHVGGSNVFIIDYKDFLAYNKKHGYDI